MRENDLYYKVHANRGDVKKIVHLYALWKPSEESYDGVDEMQIVRESYDDGLVTLFHEEDQLGIQLPVRPEELTDEQRQWLEARGLRELESDPYFDYEFNEETVAKGPPTRYPVNEEEAADLLLQVLRDYLSVPPDQPLLATTIENPDEWPADFHAEWTPNAPPV